MPQLEVEIKQNLQLGKYGSSFLDLHEPIREKRKLAFTSQVINPFFKDDTLICKPNLTKIRNRPTFSVERGNIPQFDCELPEALLQEADFLRGNRPTKNTDPFIKEESGFNDADIRESDNFGGSFGSVNKIDQMSAVAGICFTLLDPNNANRFFREGPQVHWSFGMSLTELQRFCDGTSGIAGGEDGGFDPPVILTDNRNNQGFNLGSRNPRFFWWWGGRLYLEIRHGLNSDKYHASVTMNSEGRQGDWQQTPKKKSFLLTRSNLRDNRAFGGWSGNRFSGPYDQIPTGRITIIFFADPCDYTEENQSDLDLDKKYVGTS